MKASMVWVVAVLLAVVPGCKKKDKGEGDNSAPKTATPDKMGGDKMAGSDTAMAGSTGAATPAEQGKAATGEDMAKRYVDCWGFWNQKDFKNLESCFTKDVTSDQVDSGMPPMTTPEAIIAYHEMIATAFPDRKGDLEVTLINGHNGATVALFTGTNTGAMKTPMGEMPATGKKVGMQVAHAVHFTDDGKTADKDWFYQDNGELMGQLGKSKGPSRAMVDKPFQSNEIVVAKDDATEKRNLENTNKGIEAFNNHDSKAMSAYLADGLVWSESGMPKDTNKAETAKQDEAMWKAFPDLKLATDSIWAAGDYVVQQGTMTGTNKGEWKEMGLKKGTGKPITSRFLQVYKWDKDGKLTNSWGFWNSALFAQQLGMAPPPATPGKK